MPKIENFWKKLRQRRLSIIFRVQIDRNTTQHKKLYHLIKNIGLKKKIRNAEVKNLLFIKVKKKIFTKLIKAGKLNCMPAAVICISFQNENNHLKINFERFTLTLPSNEKYFK